VALNLTGGVGNNYVIFLKLKYLLLLIISLPFFVYSQENSYKDGLKFIQKANKAVECNKIEKAEDLINKASNIDYGFCGNIRIKVESEIEFLKAQIANKKQQHDIALRILDSITGCNLSVNCNKRDSLKIETLFLKYGKEEVKNSFSFLKKVYKIENEFNSFFMVNLSELNYEFTFGYEFILNYSDINEKGITEKSTEFEFHSIASKYPFYKLIE